MNTFPHLQPLVWVFPESIRHDVEAAPVRENLFEGANFFGLWLTPVVLVIGDAALGFPHLLGKLLLGEPLGKAVFSEVLAKHAHATNYMQNVFAMSMKGRTLCE